MSLEYVDDPLQSAPNQEIESEGRSFYKPPLMKLADTGFGGSTDANDCRTGHGECGNVALLLFDQAGIG